MDGGGTVIERFWRTLTGSHWPLTEREAQVIEARFAGSTLDQVGRQLGVSRERVRYIEYVALRTLRQALR